MKTFVCLNAAFKLTTILFATAALTFGSPAEADWFCGKKCEAKKAAQAAGQVGQQTPPATRPDPVTATPAQLPVQNVTAGLKQSAKDAALLEFRTQPPVNMPVVITKDSWTSEMEDKYSEFVARFGAGVKASPMHVLKYYMRDPNTNMYASQDPEGVIFYSDCADLPYFLRSYFAMRNGLPMSIAVDPFINPRPYASIGSASRDLTAKDPTKTDVSPYGNIISRRGGSNIPARPGRELQYISYWGLLMDAGSTRSFRVGPLSPRYDFSDVYPVKIDRDGVRPGTLVHTNGHVMIVTAVTPKGAVEMIDAHPDNSLQFKTLDASKLDRDRPDVGFGFFRFRSAHAVGCQWM